MGEASASVRLERANPEPEALLATKMAVPKMRSDLVARPRLTERLEEGSARGVVAVVAAAGYGKTVLLADWAVCGRHPTAWLSLDRGDNDPVRFWRHLIASIERARPGIEAEVGPLLGPPAPPSFEGFAAAVINALVDQTGGEGLLLVLDDYHLIDSEPVHRSLGFLLEHRPADLRLVLASRSDPPLALARLRARGELTDIRATDLRFSDGEAAELLRNLGARPGLVLPDSTAAALSARTEGWAAGLQLAALSLRGQPDVAAFVAAFRGSHRYVLDYLAEEVLAGLTEQLRAFLLETSILNALSGPLCDAVTGSNDSQEVLEQVERAGLFLLPLDEVRGWWRYHQLFADLLRARLTQQPDRSTQLHRRAAAWYDEHEMADDAVRHAVAAGDMYWAARLIEGNFDRIYCLRGEAATLRDWLSALPEDLVWTRPRLLLAQAQLAAAAVRVDEEERLVDAAERAWADTPSEQFQPPAGSANSLLVNVPALIAIHRSYLAILRGDGDATAAFASRALANLGEGERMLEYVASCNLASAEWLRGRLAEAERAFEPSLARWANEPTVPIWGRHVFGQIQLAQVHLDAAVQTCQRALAVTAPPGRPPLPAAGPAHVCLGEVAYRRDRLDIALDHVTAGIALCRRLAYTPPLAAGLATLAWIRQARGDPAGATEAMGSATQLSPGPDGLLNPVPAHWARLLLAHGDVGAAADWVMERGLSADGEPDYPREQGYLVLARVLVAQDQPDRALTLLNRLRAAAESQYRQGSLVAIAIVRALALEAAGDQPGAHASLAAAVNLASPEGWVRVFADEGPPMAALVGRLIARPTAQPATAGMPTGFLARVQRASAPVQTANGSGRPVVPAVSGLVEQLTSRELEVLDMLAAGRSNQAIAAQLVVSLDTVKKHVSHVLGKLGAANRTEAVARARHLGLIA